MFKNHLKSTPPSLNTKKEPDVLVVANSSVSMHSVNENRCKLVK